MSTEITTVLDKKEVARLKAASRAAAKLARERELEKEHKAAELEFELNKGAVFDAIFAKAMRVKLLLLEFPGVVDYNSWWFESFKVDAFTQTLSVDEWTLSPDISRDNLSMRAVEPIQSGLDTAITWVYRFIEERDRKIQEALAIKAMRDTALAKLTPEEKKVLNLT